MTQQVFEAAKEALRQKPRPSRNDEAIREKSLTSLAELILKWMQQAGDTQTTLEEVLADCKKVDPSGHEDAYELAKDFDREGYFVDAAFVSLCECWDGSEAYYEAVAKWVEECDIVPPLPEGTRVKAKHGWNEIIGVIQKPDKWTIRRAYYVVRTAEHEKNIRAAAARASITRTFWK